MRLLTIREVVKRHEDLPPKFYYTPIEEQLEKADTFNEVHYFHYKDRDIKFTLSIIKGRYINWDWYYINEN